MQWATFLVANGFCRDTALGIKEMVHLTLQQVETVICFDEIEENFSRI